MNATAKGDYGKLGTFSPRPHCDYLWPETSITLPVPDWSSFRLVWKRKCPKVKIRNICEDTCPECYVLKNKFRFLGRQATAADADLLLSSSSGDEASSSSSSQSGGGSDKENYRDEELIAEATNHAEEAQQQRALAKARQQTATEEANYPHENRRFVVVFLPLYTCLLKLAHISSLSTSSYCIVCDYAQNVELPHFGAEQPQDIYYFSALTVNIFGIADVTTTPTSMLAYGYKECQGGKGGNNVASLILKALKEKNWIKYDGSCGKLLSIIMDNCGGQNKNNYVLRLALWLVESKYFAKVELIFYIRGHTKNACDRLFNQLKLRYHKSQTFTMGQMVELMNEGSNVTFKEVTAEDFFDYGEMLDRFYKKFPGGAIQRNHVFWVDSLNPTKIYTKVSDGKDIETIEMKTSKVVRDNDRERQLTRYVLQPIAAPGLKEIKQVELYSKFRKFVPHQFRDEICPQDLPSRYLRILGKQGVRKQKKDPKGRGDHVDGKD